MEYTYCNAICITGLSIRGWPSSVELCSTCGAVLSIVAFQLNSRHVLRHAPKPKHSACKLGLDDSFESKIFDFLLFNQVCGLLLHSDSVESCPEMQAGVAISSAADLADRASSRDIQRLERGPLESHGQSL